MSSDVPPDLPPRRQAANDLLKASTGMSARSESDEIRLGGLTSDAPSESQSGFSQSDSNQSDSDRGSSSYRPSNRDSRSGRVPFENDVTDASAKYLGDLAQYEPIDTATIDSPFLVDRSAATSGKQEGSDNLLGLEDHATLSPSSEGGIDDSFMQGPSPAMDASQESLKGLLEDTPKLGYLGDDPNPEFYLGSSQPGSVDDSGSGNVPDVGELPQSDGDLDEDLEEGQSVHRQSAKERFVESMKGTASVESERPVPGPASATTRDVVRDQSDQDRGLGAESRKSINMDFPGSDVALSGAGRLDQGSFADDTGDQSDANAIRNTADKFGVLMTTIVEIVEDLRLNLEDLTDRLETGSVDD